MLERGNKKYCTYCRQDAGKMEKLLSGLDELKRGNQKNDDDFANFEDSIITINRIKVEKAKRLGEIKKAIELTLLDISSREKQIEELGESIKCKKMVFLFFSIHNPSFPSTFVISTFLNILQSIPL